MRERERDAAESRAAAAQAESEKGSSSSSALAAAKRVRTVAALSCVICLHFSLIKFKHIHSSKQLLSGSSASLKLGVMLSVAILY